MARLTSPCAVSLLIAHFSNIRELDVCLTFPHRQEKKNWRTGAILSVIFVGTYAHMHTCMHARTRTYILTLSDRNSCTVANGGASVPEVLAPAKLEGIFAVVVVPHVLEPAHRPAVGNDEEKAQKLSMHPPRGRHDEGQEGIGDTIAVGVALAIPINLGARSGLEELRRVGRAQRPVAGDISHVIAPELVVERNVNDEVAVPPNVDVNEHQISPPNFPVALRHRGDVAPLGPYAGLEAECLECVQEGLVF